MSERNCWLPVIVVLSLIGAGVAAPALTRNGVNTFGVPGFSLGFVMRAPRPFMRNSIVTPRVAGRNADVQNDLRSRRHTRLQNGLPIVWPYSAFMDATPMTMDVLPSESEIPSSPSVIVMSSLPNGVPDRAVPETPPDYGYIAGCRSIPNGYHCDTPHNGTASSPGG